MVSRPGEIPEQIRYSLLTTHYSLLTTHASARRTSLISERHVGGGREPHKNVRHRELGRLALEDRSVESARLGGHTRQIKASAAGNDRLEMRLEFAGAEAFQIRQRVFPEQAHAVAGQEQIDAVPLLERRRGDEKAQRGPGWIICPGVDVDEKPGHRRPPLIQTECR